ncbi:hypothetical protein HEN52_023900, partial [Escherichia coli]|nr:hypothetical protein [Escherichia coli]
TQPATGETYPKSDLFNKAEIEVKYPSVHVAPLQNNDLLEDFFSPVARDGAGMREIQIRVLKGLSMLSKG